MLDAIYASLEMMTEPAVSVPAPERRRIANPPTVQDAMRIDWENLHNDWLAVGSDLRRAADRVSNS